MRRICTASLIASVAVTTALLYPPSGVGCSAPPVAEDAGDEDVIALARQFTEHLKDDEFRLAAEMFSQPLRKDMTVDELMRVWQEYELPRRAGPFREVIACEQRTRHNQQVVEVRGRWEEAVMVIRLSFAHDRISGFWLARDRSGPTPEGFRRGGYAYGTAIRELAAQMYPEVYRPRRELGIDVRILGLDGNPIDENSAVTIWRQVESEPQPRRYTVTDPRDGTIWERVSGSISGQRSDSRNGKDRFLSEKLEPGVYRVTAFVGSRKERMLGMASSEPIHLDGSDRTVTAKIAVEAGPRVTLTVLDAETREPIDYPRPGIRLTRADGLDVEWNPLNGNLFPGDDGTYHIEHLAPGLYRLNIETQSYAYGYPDYKLADALTIDVVGDGPNEFQLLVPPMPVSEDEAERRWSWAVQGVVTDSEGRPVEGAAIRAARGWGTLSSTMPVFSDARGRYLLRFGPGMRMKNDESGEWGAGIQAATISVRKDGYAEKNLGRQGGLLMGDTLPEDDSQYDRDKIILPGKPYRVDFTMVPAASVAGRLLDQSGQPLAAQRLYLSGDLLGPSTNVAGSGRTDADGRFQFEGIAPGFARWFALPDAEDFVLPRTQSVTLDEGAAYEIVLQVSAQAAADKMLRIASLKNAQGQDVLQAVLGDDPRGRPLVDEDLARRACDILDRVAEVNRYWFRALPEDVDSFSYTFHLAGEAPRTITHEDYASARSWYREWYPKGISYTGAARVLVSLRDRAKFRVVDMGDEQISIYFVLRGLPSTVAAGHGISGTWKGFFNAKMVEGLIKLDAKRLTPLSIEYGKRTEVYSDYVEVTDGCYVPQRIQIRSPGTEYDFRFRVYEPSMWLFDRSFRGSEDRYEDPVAWTTDIVINGQPAAARGHDVPRR